MLTFYYREEVAVFHSGAVCAGARLVAHRPDTSQAGQRGRGARLMAPSLLRKYLARLVKAGLVERYTHRGRARLRLTLAGMGVAALYQRHLLSGARQYERKQSIE